MAQLDPLVNIFAKLGHWVNNGSRESVDKIAQGLASNYRGQIALGLEADGSPMKPLSPATKEGPIRREGNQTLRSVYGSVPLSASASTANSIQAKRVSSDEWEISPQTDHGRRVLLSNAKTSHKGDDPFYGDVNKPVRDPLSVSDIQLNFVENKIFNELDSMINGL